ncbi:MAG: sulfotransferase [Casimicrobiaceae bacterium]
MATTPLVFVLGTGRCGTHTTWKIFESLPRTLSLHEGTGVVRQGPPETVGRKIVLGCMPEVNAYLYHAGNEGVFHRTFDPDPEMMGMLGRSFGERRKLVEWCEKHGVALCLSNPFAYNLATYLHRTYPHAKFIHLVRDGYACVRSWSRRQSTYPDRLPDLDAVGWILAKPVPFASDPFHAVWANFTRVERISWFWAHVNANILDRFATIPEESRRVVRIEDLNAATLPDLLAFCGLPAAFAADALRAHDPSAGPAIEWTDENVARFNAIAGPMMERLGYPVRRAPQSGAWAA